LIPLVFEKKSVKIGKIRLKRTGDDGGTVKIGNTGKSAVFFRKLTWRFPSGFCRKPAVFYQKLVNER
jgi:hypothetical protein